MRQESGNPFSAKNVVKAVPVDGVKCLPEVKLVAVANHLELKVLVLEITTPVLVSSQVKI